MAGSGLFLLSLLLVLTGCGAVPLLPDVSDPEEQLRITVEEATCWYFCSPTSRNADTELCDCRRLRWTEEIQADRWPFVLTLRMMHLMMADRSKLSKFCEERSETRGHPLCPGGSLNPAKHRDGSNGVDRTTKQTTTPPTKEQGKSTPRPTTTRPTQPTGKPSTTKPTTPTTIHPTQPTTRSSSPTKKPTAKPSQPTSRPSTTHPTFPPTSPATSHPVTRITDAASTHPTSKPTSPEKVSPTSPSVPASHTTTPAAPTPDHDEMCEILCAIAAGGSECSCMHPPADPARKDLVTPTPPSRLPDQVRSGRVSYQPDADWELICWELCATGDGGLLCQCDLPPFVGRR